MHNKLETRKWEEWLKRGEHPLYFLNNNPQPSQLVPGHLPAQQQEEQRCCNHWRQCRCRHYPKILARYFRALQQLGNPGKEQNKKADAAKNHAEVHGYVIIDEPQRQVDDDFDEEDFYGSDLSHNPIELGNS